MKENDRNIWRDALAATSLGWDLAVPIFGGVLLGHFLDRWLDTGYVLTLGMLMVGIVTGFYNVARAIRRQIARDQRRVEEEKQRHGTG